MIAIQMVAAAMVLTGCTCAMYSSYLMDKLQKSVFVHYVPHFSLKNVSGEWTGWNEAGHDPDKLLENGREDISSKYYPTLGLYDVSDPDVIAAQFQQMKMIGVDGVSILVKEYWAPVAQAIELIAEQLLKYNMKAFIIFQEDSRFLYNEDSTRAYDVSTTYYDLYAWLRLLDKVQLKIEQRPVLALFSSDKVHPTKGTMRMSPEELKVFVNTYSPQTRPVIVSQKFSTEYRGYIDGAFEWVSPGGRDYTEDNFGNITLVQRSRENLTAETTYLVNNEVYDMVITSVYPGYDDFVVNGWGESPQLLVRDNDAIYQHLWEATINTSSPLVLVLSWNDYWHSTSIEPTREYSYRYLELTRTYIERFKSNGTVQNGSLRVPEYAYRMKKSGDAIAASVGKKIPQLIQQNEFIAAEVVSYVHAERIGLKKAESLVPSSGRYIRLSIWVAVCLLLLLT